MKQTDQYTCSLLLFLLSLFASSPQVIAQVRVVPADQSRSQLFAIAESALGPDDELVNGTVYAAPARGIGGDPFLNGPDWQPGDVFIHGKAFSGQEIRYDVIAGDIILKTPERDNVQHIMKLNRSQVDSFRIGNLLFVNDIHYFDGGSNQSFYEQVYAGEVWVMRRYRKRFIDSYTSTYPMGKFSDLRSDLYFMRDDNMVNINGAGSFLKLFDNDQRKEIRHFMARRHIRYKKASSVEMREVMEFCASQKYF